MVEVRVESIRVSLMTEFRVVILKDLASERHLVIFVGPFEAEAIVIGLHSFEPPRPQTHDLLESAIETLGGEIVKVSVVDMRKDIYYATITVRADGRLLEIDSRPSDAIALAVRTKTPIFVDEEVMVQSSVTPEPDISEQHPTDEEMAAFRDFVDTLDLDDLRL